VRPPRRAQKRGKLTPRAIPRAEEKCFALNAATIIDRAVELEAVGGTYANTRPTEFICLVLKLLQLQPEREIVLEYLRAEEFK
jgi:pre-mRNA-splicing factor 38A